MGAGAGKVAALDLRRPLPQGRVRCGTTWSSRAAEWPRRRRFSPPISPLPGQDRGARDGPDGGRDARRHGPHRHPRRCRSPLPYRTDVRHGPDERRHVRDRHALGGHGRDDHRHLLRRAGQGPAPRRRRRRLRRARRARRGHRLRLSPDPRRPGGARLRGRPRRADRAGHRSLKVFTTYNIGLDDGEILRALTIARDAGALTCIHAENDAIIAEARARLLAEGAHGPSTTPPPAPAKPRSRPSPACAASPRAAARR
jgi:hypothetical protein